MTISACQLRPESRGTITLASADPQAKALIHANTSPPRPTGVA
ncbi:hypothetical protein ACFQU2_13555 [Siccirubricoccus deserti]